MLRRRCGGPAPLYCETEFAIPGLVGLREALVETGRSCGHPDHRTGAVVSLVWAGIGRYMLLTGHRWLVGCASVPLRPPGAPDGAFATGVGETVRARHLAPEQYRVQPHRPWDVAAALASSGAESAPRLRLATLPPLLRGYLRLGAWVCGPPAHPWTPVSPCGDGCLPPAGAVPTVGRVHRLLRLLGLAGMLLAGAALATALPRLGPAPVPVPVSAVPATRAA